MIVLLELSCVMNCVNLRFLVLSRVVIVCFVLPMYVSRCSC